MLVSSGEVYITCIFLVAILPCVGIYTVRTGFSRGVCAKEMQHRANQTALFSLVFIVELLHQPSLFDKVESRRLGCFVGLL